MHKNLSSQQLSRRGFLAGALSLTGALSLLAGCGGGGGGGGTSGGDVTREKLIGAWKTVSLSAEGKDQTCPGTLTLTGGDTVDCGSEGYLLLRSDGTYAGQFGSTNAPDSGSWSLSGTTLTLDSSTVGTPTLTATVTLVSDTALTLLNDGVTVRHTKIPDLDRTKLIGKWELGGEGHVYLADGIFLSWGAGNQGGYFSPTTRWSLTGNLITLTYNGSPTGVLQVSSLTDTTIVIKSGTTPGASLTKTSAPVTFATRLELLSTPVEQSYLVPSSVTSLSVKLWGAGGGQNGGSGAFIKGNLAVTSGETLKIKVGQGGKYDPPGGSTTPTPAAFGGGGTSFGDNGFAGGGGGGATTLFRGTTLLAAAAGGGGGQFWGGGGGGITTGLRGNDDGTILLRAGGAGGTQSAGGAAGGGFRGGTSGSYLQGGNGTGNADATSGGGGGGYYGGAGGGKEDRNGGGGGGSSFVGGLTGVTSEDGKNGNNGATSTRVAPGGTSDPDYLGGIGTGGHNNSEGEPGYCVITFTV